MTENHYLRRIEELIIRDEKLSFTIVSGFAVLAIFLNLTFTNLPPVGAIASLTYLLINGTFLGRVFLEDESLIVRLLLGNLLLLVLLGFSSWVVVIAINLDAVRSVIVLFLVAILCSFLNRFRTRLWRQ